MSQRAVLSVYFLTRFACMGSDMTRVSIENIAFMLSVQPCSPLRRSDDDLRSDTCLRVFPIGWFLHVMTLSPCHDVISPETRGSTRHRGYSTHDGGASRRHRPASWWCCSKSLFFVEPVSIMGEPEWIMRAPCRRRSSRHPESSKITNISIAVFAGAVLALVPCRNVPS
ncbi:hypothetical protein BV22DRAFT_169449 [Leucogyrophana mollusca]|uniref:Uncharacterized protein n=1 Tax=Leucogyrophana mollusca TaxID=85980 RepID=A0ACB8BTF7_9AGAM|nr:hypothetical protein BV22DRAFT_169449 [Leucogyrophana mollusca]